MSEKRLRTEKLVTVACLIALEIILTRFVSINTPFLRIGFGFLPVAICAIMYGPITAGVAYAIGDVLGTLLFPTGGFFPGFTVSAFLTGVIYGLFLYKKDVTPKRVILACTTVMLVVNLLIGTYWLTILLGKGYLAMLPARAIKEAIMIPICSVLIIAVDKTVIKAIRKRAAA